MLMMGTLFMGQFLLLCVCLIMIIRRGLGTGGLIPTVLNQGVGLTLSDFAFPRMRWLGRVVHA